MNAHGKVIRWAFLYDLFAEALTLWRGTSIRAACLDLAQIAPGEKVLDVGCGTGELALAAKRRVGASGTVHGVDAGESMVARSRSKAERAGLEAVFAVAPAQVLPFPDGSFDAVLCTLMLHHLPMDSRLKAVLEMRRVLRPGGRLLIADLSRQSGLRAWFDPVRLVHGRRDMHAAQEAEGLVRTAGLLEVAAGRLGESSMGYVLGRAP